MKKTLASTIIFFIIASLIIGCQVNESSTEIAPAKPGPSLNKLSVVTSIFPQYDFTKEIVKDKADVQLLLKPGADSHSYEPSPQDIISIQNCDLFIYIGGENDSWVKSILESMGNKAPDTLRLIDLVDTLEEEFVEGMEHNHKGQSEENISATDHHHTLDEHVWTSPIKAIEIVNHIATTLGEKDPNQAEFYQNNAENYIEKLKTLDQKIRNLINNADRKTILFADRFPFRYFADEYGLNYYAAFTGCSTDTEASAATIAFLIDKTNELDLPVVFAIELSNEKIADSIVEATKAKKMTFHSLHNLSIEELENDESYISLMEENLAKLKIALE